MAVIKMNFLSQALGMQTNVVICLPSYSFADRMSGRDEVYVPGMKYQVLWLLHGGGGDENDYLHFSNITRYADDHKLAVVMPADYNMFYSDQPGGGKYYEYVVDELPRMCRALFPFSDKREDNFIGGLSMGSGGAYKCAMMNPDKYAAALIMSGGGLHGPRDSNANEFIEKVIAGEDVSGYLPEKPLPEDPNAAYISYKNITEGVDTPKFFFSWGSEDMLIKPDVEQSLKFFDKLGFKLEVQEEVPGYRHEWDFWDLTLRKAISGWLPIRHSAIYPGEE